MESSERGKKQSAYRITVAASEKDLKKNIYVWDSGRVESSDSVYIPYEGEEASDEIASSKININKATVEELELLNGIGNVTAQNIVAYREENGPFTSIEDIKNVTNIKDAVYEKIKNYITV